MKHWFRNLIILVLGIGLIAGGAAWYRGRADDAAAGFRTAQVTRGDVAATISATGTVEPEEVIDVGAQVAGRITEFGKDTKGKAIDYGSEIKEGMVLALIDPVLYQSDVSSATANYESATAGVARAVADLGQMQAKFQQAERDWDRAQKIGAGDALPQVDFDAYRSTYEAAKATVAVGQASVEQAKRAVAVAQANVDRANRNLNYCTITSPVNGVIIDRRVNIGQTVVSSLSAPSLFLIAKDLRRMQVWASVNEADIGNIRAGQDVMFTVDAFPNRKFKGWVGKVRLNATMTQNVVTYTVEIVTDNSDSTLLPYLTANVQFQVTKHEDVLLVPNAALRWSPTDQNQVAPEEREAAAALVASAGSRGSRGSGGGSGGEGRSTTRPSGGGDMATSRPSRGGESRARGILWLEDGKFVRPIQVRTGATDGVNTEVAAEKLKEGDAIVLGEAVAEAAGSGDARNPFAPNFRGGRSGSSSGGGGGRGR